MKFWTGKVSETDDYNRLIGNVFYDGRTIQGPWAIMNPESFRLHGVGVGTGRGQKYEKQPDDKWLKTAG